MKPLLNQLNNYTSILDIEHLYAITGEDYSAFLKQYRHVVYLTGLTQYWQLQLKKRRTASNRKHFREARKAQANEYQRLTLQIYQDTRIDINCSYSHDEVFDLMVEQHSRFHIVLSVYAKPLLAAIQYAKANTVLWKRFKQELRHIGIDYRSITNLLKAIYYQNETDYDYCLEEIYKQFQSFYQHETDRDFETLVLEAMSFDLIFTNTTSCFKRDNLRITFPELFIIKACLSQAMNRTD
ncbi:hypothetical protein [Vibrio cyclitrophicus]|uniref:hypothetical protein n=1 Tax=Vibrio cyclitrophicus TaxID=47951 RepID=UPI000CB75E92|nr:hypothetical protein [Vibrio cyclitrophicus]PMH81085.1 hypothetical protein BCU60_16450 [Vibrio cyclitrophicus]